MWVIVIVVVLVLSGCKSEKNPENKVEQVQVEKKQESFKMSNKFQINVMSDNNTSYLYVLEVAFETEGIQKNSFPELEDKFSDIINTTLSSKTHEALSLDKDRSLLKNELKGKLNTVISNGKIVDVLFPKFVFQQFN